MEEKVPLYKNSCVLLCLIVLILIITFFVVKCYFYDEPMALLINAELTDDFTNIMKIDKANEITNKFAQVLGGFGGLILLAVQIYRTVILNRQVKGNEITDRNREDQAKADLEEQRRSNISREILDQYVKAIEHLKTENVDERLAGIYLLERILSDYCIEAQAFHNAIIEYLCAFFKNNNRIKMNDIKQDSYRKDFEKIIVDKFKGNYLLNKAVTTISRIDYQTVLNVLGRYNSHDQIINKDLSFTKLDYYIICGNNYAYTTFMGCQINHSIFQNLDLSHSNIDYTIFQSCNINAIKMVDSSSVQIIYQNTYLSKSYFQNTDFNSSVINATKIKQCEYLQLLFINCKLIHCNITRTLYSNINFKNSSFSNCHITHTTFINNNIHNVKYICTNISESIFDKCIISNSFFKDASISNTKVNKGTLQNTIFNNVNLLNTNILCDDIINVKFLDSKFDNLSLACKYMKSIVFESVNNNNGIYCKIEIENSIFSNSRQRKCDYSHSTIKSCNYNEMVLIDTNFDNSLITQTVFKRAHLRNAKFQHSNITHSIFINCILYKCKFDGSKLDYSTFSDVVLNPNQYDRINDIEGIHSFIKALCTAKSIYQVNLDKCIMDIIKSDYADLLKRIEVGEPGIHYDVPDTTAHQ